TYCLHRGTDQAIVTVRVGGGRKQVYLGRYGTAASLAEYRAVLLRHHFTEREVDAAVADARSRLAESPSPVDDRRGPTVSTLYVAYLRWAEGYYRLPSGERSREIDNIRDSWRECLDLLGDREVRSLSRRDLATVRERMVERRLSRKVVNQRVGRLVRA